MRKLLAVLLVAVLPGLLWAQGAKKDPDPAEDLLAETNRDRYLFIDNGGHSDTVLYTEFFKDPVSGKQRLFTVARDRAFIIWDLETGDRLRYIRPPYRSGRDEHIKALRLAPDGKSVVFATIVEKKSIVYRLELATEKLTKIFESDKLPALCFAPDASCFAFKIEEEKETRVVVHDTKDGKKTGEMKTSIKVHEMELSPGAERIAVRGVANNYQILNLPNGAKTWEISRDQAVGTYFRWSGHRELVVWRYGERDKNEKPEKHDVGAIQVYHFPVKDPAKEVHAWPPKGWVVPEAFKTSYLRRVLPLPGPTQFLVDMHSFTGGSHRHVGYLDLKTMKLIDTKQSSTGQIPVHDAFAVSPNGKRVALGRNEQGEVMVFGIEEEEGNKKLPLLEFPLKQILGHRGEAITGVKWSTDSTAIAWRIGKLKDETAVEHGLDLAKLEVITVRKRDSSTYAFMPKQFGGVGGVGVGEGVKGIGDTLTLPIKGVPGTTKISVPSLGFGSGGHCVLDGKLLFSDTLGGFGIYNLANGEEKFRRKPYYAYTMSSSVDGRYMALVRNDQTIEIYNPKTNEFLLRIYAEGTDWIAWTREGYYACSPGGERFLKWHVHRGDKTVAKIYPIEQFRNQLNKEGVIKAILETGSVDKAVKKSAGEKAQPFNPDKQIKIEEIPQVEFIKPDRIQDRVENQTGEVSIQVKTLLGEKGTVAQVRLFLNGRPQTPPQATDDKGGKDWKVTLTEGTHKVRVLATVGNQAAFSNEIEITYSKPGVAKATAPRLLVRTIGIDYKTRKDVTPLNCAENDAKVLSAFFKEQKNELFSGVDVKELVGKDATLKGIQAVLEELANAQPGDTVILQFSGHGVVDENKVFYLYPHDVDEKKLKTSALSGEDLKGALRKIKARRVLVLLDACHSGAIGSNQLATDLYGENAGIAVICSARANEQAREGKTNGHFTACILDVLKGKGNYNPSTGEVCLHHLYGYVVDNVPSRTSDEQHPVGSFSPSISPATFILSKKSE